MYIVIKGLVLFHGLFFSTDFTGFFFFGVFPREELVNFGTDGL